MDSKQLLKKAESLFKSSESMTLDKLEGFVHETLKFFEELRHALATGSEEDKKVALNLAIEMQRKFQAIAEKTYKQMGMSPDQISRFLTPDNLSDKEWKVYQSISGEIEEYRKENPSTPSSPKPTAALPAHSVAVPKTPTRSKWAKA